MVLWMEPCFAMCPEMGKKWQEYVCQALCGPRLTMEQPGTSATWPASSGLRLQLLDPSVWHLAKGTPSRIAKALVEQPAKQSNFLEQTKANLKDSKDGRNMDKNHLARNSSFWMRSTPNKEICAVYSWRTRKSQAGCMSHRAPSQCERHSSCVCILMFFLARMSVHLCSCMVFTDLCSVCPSRSVCKKDSEVIASHANVKWNESALLVIAGAFSSQNNQNVLGLTHRPVESYCRLDLPAKGDPLNRPPLNPPCCKPSAGMWRAMEITEPKLVGDQRWMQKV